MTRQFIEMRRENRPNIIKRWSISFSQLSERCLAYMNRQCSHLKDKKCAHNFPHSADKKNFLRWSLNVIHKSLAR